MQPDLWAHQAFESECLHLAHCCRGRLEMDNFIMPFMGHTLTLTRTLADSSHPNTKYVTVRAKQHADFKSLVEIFSTVLVYNIFGIHVC